jgi:hypothetical protein
LIKGVFGLLLFGFEFAGGGRILCKCLFYIQDGPSCWFAGTALLVPNMPFSAEEPPPVINY